MPHRYLLILAFLLSATGFAIADEPGNCTSDSGVVVQVLGSGGPIADDGRASTAYLVWVDGRARGLIDVGGGAFLRFGEAGAEFSDLDFIGISHFHTDHSADLPALLKSGYFSERTRPLDVAGPGPGGPFPGLADFMAAMLAKGQGAYGYLAGYLDGSGGLVKLNLHEIPVDTGAAAALDGLSTDLIGIDALAVPHGIVPTVAYRVRVGGQTLVFASDQRADDPAFPSFARDADLLVMHLVIPGDAGEAARKLHATPRAIGEAAAASGTKLLLLSHFMARSLQDLEANVDRVKGSFSGAVQLAEDLICVALPAAPAVGHGSGAGS